MQPPVPQGQRPTLAPLPEREGWWALEWHENAGWTSVPPELAAAHMADGGVVCFGTASDVCCVSIDQARAQTAARRRPPLAA